MLNIGSFPLLNKEKIRIPKESQVTKFKMLQTRFELRAFPFLLLQTSYHTFSRLLNVGDNPLFISFI
jgi:hypothetical protein